MQQKSIFPVGIIRNTPNEATVDGALLEAINTRNKDGARRGVGLKVESSERLDIITPAHRVYYHPNSDIYVCSVLRGSNYVVEIYKADSNGGQRYYFAANPSNVNIYSSITFGTVDDLIITHTGNFVFCSSVSAKKSVVLYWNAEGGSFVELESLQPIRFAAGTTNNTAIECTLDVSAESDVNKRYDLIIGQFSKIIAENRKKGLFNGHMAFRYAFKLFDGSFVMHSEPFYVKGGYAPADVPSGGLNGLQVNYTLGSNATIYNDDTIGTERLILDQVRLYVDATQVLTILQQWADLKLIRSVCVYATSILEGYSIPDTPNGLYVHPSGLEYFPYKDDLSEVFDPQSMFLIKEWTVDELTTEFTYDIPDLTGLDQNEGISADNFTHHKYLPGCQYTYNNRYHFGDVNTSIGNPLSNAFRLYFSAANPDIVPNNYIETHMFDLGAAGANGNHLTHGIPANIEMYCVVDILTNNGIKKKTVKLTDNFYTNLFIMGGGSMTLTFYSLLLNPVITYPDARAKKLSFAAKDTTTGLVRFGTAIDLIPSTWSNFAYSKVNPTGAYRNNQFYGYADFMALPIIIDIPTPNNTYNIQYNDTILDNNRVQVSMLNNPFVFPAENSYRFGSENNTVVGMITAQEPITETVFGQYPLNVFTENGIYALEQGSDGVLYSNVVELNKEVLSNPKGLYGITGAILFVTKEGLKVLQGRQVTNISLDVRGSVENPVIGSNYLSESLLDEKVCVLLSYLSNDFVTFIQDAVIGFSNVFQEIYVSRPDAPAISYVYNLDSKSWHTITIPFSQFIGSKGYYNKRFLDLNTENGLQEYYLQTRPFFLGDQGHKKINQLSVRANRTIALNEYDALVVFGSNDGKNFEAIGKMFMTNDTPSPVMKNLPGHYRYFILCYMGRASNLSIISVDITFTSRYTNKLR